MPSLEFEASYVRDPQPLWDWMNERHSIYLKRQAGAPRPWTTDPVMQQFSFCNVFRELDRVTIWVRENIREPFADHPHLWFMLAVARTINWPPTLQRIIDAGLWPTGKVWKELEVAQLLGDMGAAGEKVYTGAYMIRAESDPNNPWYKRTKHEYITGCVLGNLWEARQAFNDSFLLTLQDTHRWFLPFHGWGPFMAYEVVTDMRWTRYLQNAPDIYTWANAGPGALRGLNRIEGKPLTAPRSAQDATRMMRDLLDLANDDSNPPLDAPLYFWSGEYRPLEMRDIEHSLCEMDKWLRAKSGEGRPRARYK